MIFQIRSPPLGAAGGVLVRSGKVLSWAKRSHSLKIGIITQRPNQDADKREKDRINEWLEGRTDEKGKEMPMEVRMLDQQNSVPKSNEYDD